MTRLQSAGITINTML